jgi:hypothetical protein
VRRGLPDAEAVRIGVLLADHPDPGVRAHAAWLQDPRYFKLAALVEEGLRMGMKRTTDGTGAYAWAIRESGLKVSEATARRAHERYYPPVALPNKPDKPKP